MPRRLRPVFYGLPVPRFLFSLSGDCLLPGTAIRFFRGVGCEKHAVRSSVTPYGVVMAGALISALPLLVVFFLVQKRFVEGIAMTGMK